MRHPFSNMRVVIAIAVATGCTGSTGDSSSDRSTDTGSAATTGDTGSIRSTGDTALPFDPCARMTLEAGNGEKAHVPSMVDDPVTIVHGPQGGWHIDVSGQVTGSGTLVAVDAFVTESTSGTQLAGDQPSTYLVLDPVESCIGEFAGVRALIDDADLPKGVEDYQAFVCTLEDQPLEVRVVITDVDSKESVSSTLTLVAQLDPLDDAYNCP